MTDFHVTLSPGVLPGPERPIVISFDSPESAQSVDVTLSEADRWGSGEEQVREAGGDDLIAVFRGAIVDGRFQGELARQGRARRGAPTIRVRFDGQDQTHELAVPSGGNEHEGGVLEIQCAVSGRIGRRRARYRTPSPVFVRRFERDRPVVALITGRDGYANIARRYWSAHGDGRFDRRSLEEVLEFARTESERRGYGPWGELNVVSHGNEWDWMIRLFRSDRRARAVFSSVLRREERDARLQPRPAGQLDRRSRVVIRGCVLGRNQALLDQIRGVFGGQAAVYAPKYLQTYWFRGRDTGESFTEGFFYYLRGGRRPAAADAARELDAKYPGRLEDAEWRRLLGARNRNKTKVQRFRVTVLYDARPARDHDFVGDARSIFDEMDDEELKRGTDFEDWEWIPGRVQRSGRDFRCVVTGSRVRVEVRRPLVDAEGNPVVPNLDNPDHYGRSPVR